MDSDVMKAAVPAIEFLGVDKRFPARGKSAEVLAARQVSLSIQPGEVVSLIGPSGCGKSTLLNMGAGLTRPSAGVVKVRGEVVAGPNKHVAFMLQKDLLMPWRTISMSAPSASARLASSFMKLMRVASIALAAYLVSSALRTSVTMSRSRLRWKGA